MDDRLEAGHGGDVLGGILLGRKPPIMRIKRFVSFEKSLETF
jgi:hypothetical protein